VSDLGLSSNGLTKDEARLGLAPRFEVSIDGHDLGGWQQCIGLGVDYSTESLQEMGENTTVHYLRGQGKYQQILLSRAMVSNVWSASTIHWLEQTQQYQAPQTATITLKDAWNDTVAGWSLQRVLPVKWQGPTLNASSKDVAVEKLTLAHEGFHGLSENQTVSKARIADASGAEVKLQFNPQSLTKKQFNTPSGYSANSRRAGKSTAGIGSEGEGFPPTSAGWANFMQNLGYCQYTLTGVIFDTEYGTDPVDQSLLSTYLDLFFYWLEPLDSTGKPPLLTFTWGTLHKQTNLPCTLTNSSVQFERLRYDGTPTRIKVQLTLTEVPTAEQGTNPTSGGPGGHRTHLLVADESLAAVAYREYGDAGMWPRLAKFNRIDDPARLRPGTLVRIPPSRVLERV
jgi:phage tail-like protein